jgi:hypothetical protein
MYGTRSSPAALDAGVALRDVQAGPLPPRMDILWAVRKFTAITPRPSLNYLIRRSRCDGVSVFTR